MGVPFLLYCALIFYQTGKKLSTGNLLCCDEQKNGGSPEGEPQQPAEKSFRQAAALFEPVKSFKKWFDQTRKTTLTVFFHTIFPSESFGRGGIDSLRFSAQP